MTTNDPFTLVLAIVTGVLAVARMTRLIVDDDFPPVTWLKERVALALPARWAGGLDCPWCVSPYVATVSIAWAWGSGLHWTWWLANVIAATSWVAAWLCMRDIPPDQRA